MESALIIHNTGSDVRVALMENDVATEIYVERRARRGVVGNLYRGRVIRVLPGMQAAFVDIGLDRSAFLYVNDALPTPPAQAFNPEVDAEPVAVGRRGYRPLPAADISDVVRVGQDLLVQVQKEPMGTKGARLTRHAMLPGRFLVFMPFSNHLGISQRIEDARERERLKRIMQAVMPPGSGFVVRTAAADIDAEVLVQEAEELVQRWRGIAAQGEHGAVPRLIAADLDLILRTVRELFSDQIHRIITDNPDDVPRLVSFVAGISPGAESRVEAYTGDLPIFDHFGITTQLNDALERRIWLKSGGYLVIDPTEALTVIDVNSGRYVGKTDLEDTITKINMEAVPQIAHQLRLRNIGGIVIIDFIDMALSHNRERVYTALQEALKRDKAKSTLVHMSEIGVVEMTRKRVRESLVNLLTMSCPYCRGCGSIKSPRTVAQDMLSAVVRLLRVGHTTTLHIKLHPDLATYITTYESEAVQGLETRFGCKIILSAEELQHRQSFELNPVTS